MVERLDTEMRLATQSAVFEDLKSESDLSLAAERLEKVREKLVGVQLRDTPGILNVTPTWPLWAHIFSACFCMGCSALFHLMWVQSPSQSAILARLDYGGISFLIFGSSFPVIWYGYPCEETMIVRNVELIFMATACLGCFIVTLIPKFDQARF